VLVRVGQEVQEVPRGIADRPVRVAVLGFWHVHAPDYAELAAAHPGCELVAAWDDDPGRGRAGADRFGIAFAPDLGALLARDDVDAVTVTTATRAHREVIGAAIAAGKHVFSEKVLAPTVAGCEALVTAADTAGVALVVNLPRLHHGVTVAVDELLAAGALGRLTYGRVRLSHDGAVAGWLPERFVDPADALGGALIDLGCHPVYLIQRWLGARPETVSATYGAVTGRAAEDHAVVTASYGDGRIGVMETGFVSADPFTIELHGSGGVLHYADPPGVLQIFADGAWSTRPVPPDADDAFTRWVGHIRAGTRAEDNLARAVELTRLVAAANASATTGRAVAP
jgi:1,5-anhydro-D-fructose reductase (1,5-anhydro-D-mannitol-forming)